MDIVSKGLVRLGMQSRQLRKLGDTRPIPELLQPSQAKRQPITEKVARLLNSAYTRKEQYIESSR